MRLYFNGQPLSTGGVAGGDSLPKGTIVIWSGAADAIPTGWHLCDGTNGTPDLRGRFVLGATTELDGDGNTAHPVESSGGEETVTLTVGQMPMHSHQVSTAWASAQEYAVVAHSSNTADGPYFSSTTSTTSGSSQPHNNMPPYYTLCYIMKMVDGATSGGSNSSSPNDIYSTEEVRIGTWIDGKPLYRKVIEYNNALNNYSFGLFSKYAENIDSIVDMRGYIRKISGSGSSNTQFIIGSPYHTSTKAIGSGFKIDGNVTDTDDSRSFEVLVWGVTTGSGDWKYIVILEYTKTTDTPEVS